MRRAFIGGGIILLGIAGVFLLRIIQTKQTPAFIPRQTHLELQPPATALTGTLAWKEGDVLKTLRDADDFTPATASGTVLQGETIATKKGKALVTLQDAGTVSLMDASEVSFVNLVPDALLLRQKSGTVSYEVNSLAPFSIRILHTLVTINGDASITLGETAITLRITKGTAKLALVDADNNTQIWDLVQGDRALIDDDARTVLVRK